MATHHHWQIIDRVSIHSLFPHTTTITESLFIWYFKPVRRKRILIIRAITLLKYLFSKKGGLSVESVWKLVYCSATARKVAFFGRFVSLRWQEYSMRFKPIDLLRLFLVLNVNTCCQCNKHSVVLDYIVSQTQQNLMSIFAKPQEQPEV